MRRWILILFLAGWAATASAQGTYVLQVDSAQSRLTATATIDTGIWRDTEVDSSYLAGTVTADLTPGIQPYSFTDIHLTGLDLKLPDALAFRFELDVILLRGELSVRTDSAGLALRMIQAGPSSPLNADGSFEQPDNMLESDGTVVAVGSGALKEVVGVDTFSARTNAAVTLAGHLGMIVLTGGAGGELWVEVPLAFEGEYPVSNATATIRLEGTLIARAALAGTGTEPDGDLPATLTLHGNYPNPFNPATTVVFDLAEPAMVGIEVFDLTGRRVLSVAPRPHAPGTNHHLLVDGSALHSGAYLYRLTAAGAERTAVRSGTMMLAK